MIKIVNFLTRSVLTALLVFWMISPFVEKPGSGNVVSEIVKFGVVPSLVIVSAFFIMVFFIAEPCTGASLL